MGQKADVRGEGEGYTQGTDREPDTDQGMRAEPNEGASKRKSEAATDK